MSTQQQQKSGGAKKHGRSKRALDSAMSQYVKGKISFATYAKRKGVIFKAT